MIENYDHYLRIYYSDGHNEIRNEQLKDYIQDKKVKNGYKQSITIEGIDLFPTANMRYKECQWVNLDYLEEGNKFFITLLKEKEIFEEVKKMFIREKKKQMTSL